MLTRSKARCLTRQQATPAVPASVMVSPSATGKGTHTRWQYPEDDTLPTPAPTPRFGRPRRFKADYTATYLITEESQSSISSHSSSGEDASLLTPDSSFEARTPKPMTPQHTYKPCTTPPRLSPKKLLRSPGRCRWTTDGGVTRVVFSEESTKDATLRDSQTNIKLDHISERELEKLLREREMARARGSLQMFDMDMDTATEASESMSEFQFRDHLSVNTGPDIEMEDTHTERESSGQWLAPAAYIRGDTEPAEEVPPMVRPSIQRMTRRLGPEGTELVDPVTFRPYSMESFEGLSKVEIWRQNL